LVDALKLVMFLIRKYLIEEKKEQMHANA